MNGSGYARGMMRCSGSIAGCSTPSNASTSVSSLCAETQAEVVGICLSSFMSAAMLLRVSEVTVQNSTCTLDY